jgi:hypothetical protein
MFSENKNEISVAEKPAIDAEEIWGGDESEWANWRTAERDMEIGEYNMLQMKEMVSDRTKEAFEKVYGTLAKDISPDLLANLLAKFFIDNGGTRYFRRRFLFRFKDSTGFDSEKIKQYYEGKLWEKETNEHA